MITNYDIRYNTSFAFGSVIHNVSRLSLISKKVSRMIPSLSKQITQFVLKLNTDLSSLYPLFRGIKIILLEKPVFAPYFRPIMNKICECVTLNTN